MATTVIHVHDAPYGWKQNPDYVYIGRYNSHHGLQHSIWHNPYKMRPCPVLVSENLPRTVAKKIVDLYKIEERQRVINAYYAYLKYNEALQARLYELQDKILVCWCHPESCHGDVLAQAVNNLRIATVARDINDLDAWLAA